MRTRITFSLFALLLSVGIMIGLAGTASAQIAGTKHDLNQAPYSLGLNFICQPCHHPHPPATNVMTSIPLGNRSTYATAGAVNTAPAFTMYTSGTIDQPAQQPLGMDLLCLSCHEGTIGTDAFGGSAGTGATSINTLNATAPGNFGTNLGGEHPISVDYDLLVDTANAGATPLDPGFNDVATAEGLGIKFFVDGQNASAKYVRCASCHEPHSMANPPFLRLSAATLCGSCHTK